MWNDFCSAFNWTKSFYYGSREGKNCDDQHADWCLFKHYFRSDFYFCTWAWSKRSCFGNNYKSGSKCCLDFTVSNKKINSFKISERIFKTGFFYCKKDCFARNFAIYNAGNRKCYFYSIQFWFTTIWWRFICCKYDNYAKSYATLFLSYAGIYNRCAANYQL